MTVTTTFSLDYLGNTTLAHPAGERPGNSEVVSTASSKSIPQGLF